MLNNINEENLLKAMKMEKEYRKLQTDKKNKTKFGYHEKLKAFGFRNTVEYEEAKDKYYFKNTKFQILEIKAPLFISKLHYAIKKEKETIFIVHPEKLMAWIGEDPYNEDYCKKNNIPTFNVGYRGGTIVTGPEDLAIGLLIKGKDTRNYFSNILFYLIKEKISRIKKDGNDITLDGYKVFGIGYKKIENMYLATYQITVKSYPSEIENICLKETTKKPKGLNEIDNFDKTEFIERLKQWLQQ